MKNTNTPTTKPKNKLANILTIFAIIILVSLVFLSYQFKNSFLPKAQEVAPIDESCDLREDSCTTIFSKGEDISFSISPKNLPLLKPLSLTVKSRDIQIENVEIDLVGMNMDMGPNHTSLKKIAKNHYVGSTIIPMCSESKMEWEARVFIKTKNGSYMAPFKFFTQK